METENHIQEAVRMLVAAPKRRERERKRTFGLFLLILKCFSFYKKANRKSPRSNQQIYELCTKETTRPLGWLDDLSIIGGYTVHLSTISSGTACESASKNIVNSKP